MVKVAIIGATGYGGAELIRLLQQHPDVILQSYHSSSQEGESITGSYPHLRGITEMDLQGINPENMAHDADVVFTATPSNVSAEIVPELLEHNAKVIDLSGGFRLKDKDLYESWYRSKAPDQQRLNEAVYGLTEWCGPSVADADLISNPGCYPTAALLGIAPLVKQTNVEPTSIIIDGKTGVSGAGRKATPVTHFTEMNDNLKIYKVNEHQHTPEIEQMLAAWNKHSGAVTFSTHLVPMTRGIMTTIYVDAPADMTTEKLFDLYSESYKNCYFVRVRDQGDHPSTKDVYGSNFCDLSLAYDERTNRIMIVSVIDNLVKGAAGQAVQNMNKMFGMDETTGLNGAPVYP